jgi:HEAT repeat protein
MRKRSLRVLICVLLTTIVIFVGWRLFEQRWPSYDGQSFNHWAELALRQDPQAIPALREGLSHSNRDVRFASAASLGYLGPTAKPVVPELTALLHDGDADVRLASVNALTLIDVETPDAVLAFKSALVDADPRVRQSAELALRYIKTRSTFARAASATVGCASAPYGVGALSALATLATSCADYAQR